MLITPEQLRHWRACYTDARILHLFAGRPALTLVEVVELPIAFEDRLWVVCHATASLTRLSELACCFAEQALTYLDDDEAVAWARAVIDARRSYLRDGGPPGAARTALESSPPVSLGSVVGNRVRCAVLQCVDGQRTSARLAYWYASQAACYSVPERDRSVTLQQFDRDCTPILREHVSQEPQC